ncbi:hypothetical protein L6164_018288 [Bauhinia variegata]|uniref:Uncharacterized protein n=1 Tax=Bauhinia variegata TaxID=167791 RepID=A0ACB9NCR2_BAUVA|nr:hypothetical protein L6164_018288 [Bauhinia variegata]
MDLANISTLKSLVLQLNQLSGTLPPELGNLTQLEELLLTSNNFTGEIPATFAKLTALQDLVIRGTGLSGPSPFGVSLLTQLNELIITDLNGPTSTFPRLDNLTNLDTLDLSFNNLSGPISSSYDGLRDADYMNLSASSSPVNDSGAVSCLSSMVCRTPLNRSFHINCGGKQVAINGSTYDADLDIEGPSKSQKGGANWAYSNTGDFWFSEKSLSYKRSIQSCFAMDNEKLYKSARVSSISLTYYGYCLANGSYTVKLHFAEIIFTDDETYRSLGRRIFDVYIHLPELLTLSFITQTFTAEVTNKTLEIRFQWAGRGTTAIPFYSVYGPLISAISEELVKPPDENGSSKISGATLAGILAAGVIAIILALLLKEKGNLMELVDGRLGSDFNEEEVIVMIKVALLCTSATATNSYEVLDEKKLEVMRQYYREVDENKETEIEK